MKLLFIFIFSVVLIPNAFSQRRPDGPPPGEGRHKDWVRGIDTDRDGLIEAIEFQSAIERTFADLDEDGDGVIELDELPKGPRRELTGPPPVGRGDRMNGQPPGGRHRLPGEAFDKLPPFFFMHKLHDSGSLNKAEFERVAKEVFTSMDSNNDGVLGPVESKPPNRGREGHRPPPNAMFIAAELRFGDKLVKNQPFSAEILIEDTRRLFDGTTVTKKIQGAIYRDASGRTRREQPLEMFGGFNIVTENNKPQMLVFINDFAANTQYFLDLNQRIARKNRIGQGPPRDEPEKPGAKSEALGAKTIEGISVEGTRITYDLPAGHIGNDKPIQVVTENWYSPELQMIVMSRHLDPLSGEHIFRLLNIKRSEPAADLFTVPAGFRIEGKPER
ncbi:MAG: hypothetical protein ACKVRN_13820 [Pyrinomonadaceae bacterium]